VLRRDKVDRKIEVDRAKIDIFALGVMLWMVYYEREPWGETQEAKLSFLKEQPWLYDPEMKHLTKTLLSACLNVDPKKRPSAQRLYEMVS